MAFTYRSTSNLPSQDQDPLLTKYAPLEVQDFSGEYWPGNNRYAPLLCFGLGVTYQSLVNGGSLVAYAKKKGLFDPDQYENEDVMVLIGALLSIPELKKECGCNIYITSPVSEQYTFVVSIFRNWSAQADWMNKDQMVNALLKLREALDDYEQEPMWYFDAENPRAKGLREHWIRTDS
jgi:hypothetical protein